MSTNNVSKERIKIYQSLILEKIPSLLSLQDRERFSPTYGCFDRTYWQWKFIDFPGARFQEALFALCYVYANNFKDNIFFHNPKLLEWIEAGFLFYKKIQHKDGSFDEAYPYERSFVATGFTLFYLTEAFIVIRVYFKKDIQEEILTTFDKAGKWLLENSETHAFISNHRAGTAVGLYNLSKLMSDNRYEKRCWDIWETIKNNQSVDGWYNEYGGADPGYLTQGIYYTAVMYLKSKNDEVLHSLRKAIDFIKYFIHPDGTIGGEYGSRNTEFYFPGGFEILSQYSPIAETICKTLLPYVKEMKIPCLNSVDIYNIMPILNSVVSGCIFFCPNLETKPIPYSLESDFIKVFDDFKICVRKSGNLYTVIGISKGGVIKVYDIERTKLILSSVGVFGEKGDRILTSQCFHKKELQFNINDNMIMIEGFIYHANYALLSPLKMVLFRILSLLSGLSNSGSRYLKKLIVYLLISRDRRTKWKFKRIITFDELKGASVHTEIDGLPEVIFKEMEIHTSYHMGSSKYYKHSDLC